ncbi:MAG: HypC/HybG/HupF family hydrogenase formation chaperone [Bacteroidales bacterium]|nr:HypC/HybG/HupF family hydrogenase formation chaperone [Bacteroidales bacterium]MCF8402341.1 HypC/HybG/HupF family hydrogenase formation chaperone [Bacteroidales bacterium]
MCLAVPGQIKKIDETGALRMAVVDFNGVEQDICIEWLPEANVGDYVLAHVGTALSMIDEESAKASLDAFDEIADLLEQEALDNSN